MKIRKEDVYEHLEMLYEIVGDEKYLEIIRMYGEIAGIGKLGKGIMGLI